MTLNQDFDQLYFSTFDLGLSAGILATGYSLDHLDRTDPRKVQFVFKRESGLDDVIQQYWANQLKITAQTYFNAIKSLKNQIYSQ